jgi:hypothetical protein
MSWASSFRFESRPGSRASTAGTGAQRSVPPTPTFDYDYGRSPTPVYQRQGHQRQRDHRDRTEEVVIDGAFADTTTTKKRTKKARKKKRKNRKEKDQKRGKKGQGAPDPTDFDDPGEFQTTCRQGTDPDHPNHVIW